MTMRSALGSKRLACALLGSLVLGSVTARAQTPTAAPAPTLEAAPPTAATPAAPAEEFAPAPQPMAPAPPPAVVAPAPPVTPPPPMAPATEKPKLPAYLMLGVGSASFVAGTVFGIVALSSESDYNKNPTYSKADTVHSETIASDVGLGLGVVLLVSGAIFYFIDDKDASAAEQAKRKPGAVASVAIAPVIDRQTRGGAVTFSF